MKAPLGQYGDPVTIAPGAGAPVAMAAGDATYSETTDRAIPDAGVLDVPFTLTGAGDAQNFACSFWIEHTFPDDLVVELVTPNGDLIVMCANDAGGFSGIGTGLAPDERCTVTPDASVPWSRFNAPQAGTYLPHNPHDPIPAGTPVAGIWTFRVTDTGEGDTGTLHGLSVTVSPTPSTVTTPIWDAGSLAGLTALTSQTFNYRYNVIALSGSGASADSFATRSFTYDDQAFGELPDGVLRTLTSCAVSKGDAPSGQYVQLLLSAVRTLGEDASGLEPVPIHRGGTVDSFTAEMAGIGPVELAVPQESSDAGSLVTFDSVAPWDVAAHGGGPLLLLLRPTALSWPGQWARNDVNRTIWKVSEVGVVTAHFSVTSQSADVQMQYTANGYE